MAVSTGKVKSRGQEQLKVRSRSLIHIPITKVQSSYSVCVGVSIEVQISEDLAGDDDGQWILTR